MAIYLGGQKVGAILTNKVFPNSLTGTAISDDDGIITFPELNFTPKIITVWNVK
jgi:hypothetical protein